MISVVSNLSIPKKDELTIISGHYDLLQSEKFTSHLNELEELVSESTWKDAIKVMKPKSVQCLHLDKIKLISIPYGTSRHNSKSNSHSFYTQLKSAISVRDDSQWYRITLVTKYEHALALVSTVARAFPLFSKKTAIKRITNVKIELFFTDVEEVNENDIQGLRSIFNDIRATALLVDIPSNEMNCEDFYYHAIRIAEEEVFLDAKPTVFRGKSLQENGFNGIYHVGKASPFEPAFVVLSHKPKGAKKTFALVGKGIMFDTGGLSIKTKTGMPGWKCDMAGAAACLQAFRSLVLSDFTENLHVCLCIAENCVSPTANKPDDIITLLSGKTVEINNTDAEGRLVLSDGVYYAKHFLEADVVIDLATLTSLQSSVSGCYHAAILTNSEQMEQKVRKIGQYCGDLVHPMQFVPDMHMGDFRSSVADMKNSNLGGMQGAPSEIAGLFIGSNIDFGEGIEWLHIDMGSMGMKDERATAYGVPLLVSLLGEYTNAPILSGKGNTN